MAKKENAAEETAIEAGADLTGLVEIVKGDEILHVNPSCLAAHLEIGYRVVE